ncbi:MAG: ATP-dependent RNA helicase HrpA, partial [bacterium]
MKNPALYTELIEELKTCMLEDRYKFRREIEKINKTASERSKDTGNATKHLLEKISRSRLRARKRALEIPNIAVPGDLPISQYWEKLAMLIQANPVVIVCGETGSGKSTQIPKICMSAGFGLRGLICQTQPRRIAARSIAERISLELGSQLGQYVGYRVRFSELIDEGNYLRVMTDGMLLAEIEKDRYLNRYEVLIIDEAHERSLNIDFLLGLTKRILDKRPEFRLIITSATLDVEKYCKHFDDSPSVAVSGRTYPVECRYRPLESGEHGVDALPQAISSAIKELHQEALGDVLVFLPGEREIRESAAWLKNHVKSGLEILPLYARLTPAEQHRIFHPGSNVRIILATNVAETSITVPGIRYVVDSGLARVSRYSPTRKLQRLPLEKISRASANQRAGRCGRLSDGICIRLYDEEDYLNRPHYTDPEIQRTSLADVILRMKSMGIGDIESFPFIDRPGRRHINDGLQHLIELGALDQNRSITSTGRSIARMPVDPRIARMLLAARTLDCLQEVVVIASALSLPDPRYNPSDKLEHARQKHRGLSKESSDFLVYLDLWRQFRGLQKSVSKRRSYKWCEENYLSVFRMREWGALQASLKRTLKHIGFRFNNAAADPQTIHRALLAGLLSNVAQLNNKVQKSTDKSKGKEKSRRKKSSAEYNGTFGKKFQIFPGSVMRDNQAKWIMSAELVETGQVFARTVTAINPQWIESAAEHLLQFHYSDPHWDQRQERVVARRRATLYGLTVYSGRKCDYSKINPADCRMIFIRTALVDGALDSSMTFYVYNRSLIKEVES